MKIENHISELLYHHDCVIVADMGGFVGNYRPAYLHHAHQTFSPPSKKIAFNASLTQNDGLLATHIGSRLNITYSEACNIIRDFKEESFNILNNGGQLSLDKIGVLYLDHEKNIQFTADLNTNYLTGSFGLSTVHAQVLKREFEQDTIIKAFEKTFEKNEKRSWWRLLEAIPVAAAIAFLLLSQQSIDPVLNKSLNSFDPLDSFTQSTVSNYNAPSAANIAPVEAAVVNDSAKNDYTESAIPSSTDDAVSKANNATAVNTVTEIKVSTEPLTTAYADKSESIFYIVAGCFKVKANAENFKNELTLKGYNASIVGTYKGLQVVSCAVAATQSEADTTLQTIKQSLEAGAWIMKK